jgi:hypothetical protein
MNLYDYSVRSSLVQRGSGRHVTENSASDAEIKELENLLNDHLAKQRVRFYTSILSFH